MNKSKVIIRPVGICDSYEVGNWSNYDNSIKLVYKDENYQSKHSDTSFYIKDKDIIGYVMSYNIINTNKEDIISLYSKKLVIYDFAISDRAYAKYGLLLLNYFLNFASKNGYQALEIKNIAKYSFFINFLKRHYKLTKFNDSFYILIENTKIPLSQKHLVIYENENIKIEDVYFLYDLQFKVLKNSIKLKLNDNETIFVDRKSGKISLPSNVKLLHDDLFLNSTTIIIIFIVIEMYYNNDVKNLYVNYFLDKPNDFEAYSDDLVYVNKDNKLLSDNINYVLNLIDKKISSIHSYYLNYDMNDRTITRYNSGVVKCDNLIEKTTFNCDLKTNNFQEIKQVKKQALQFNLKLKSIKQIDFIIDEIQLSIIFDDLIKINLNSKQLNNIKLNKDEIIKDLERFNFINLKEYIKDNSVTNNETASIKLLLENEIIEYVFFDKYPNIWPYVKWFVNKYSNL